MKLRGAEQSLLGVAHAAAQVLDYPDSKLHDVATELRAGASSLLTSLAAKLREPTLDVSNLLTELQTGLIDLIAKAIEAGEDPENEIDFSVRNAKENIATLLEYYADELQGGSGLQKILTHPSLTEIARATIEVASAVQ